MRFCYNRKDGLMALLPEDDDDRQKISHFLSEIEQGDEVMMFVRAGFLTVQAVYGDAFMVIGINAGDMIEWLSAREAMGIVSETLQVVFLHRALFRDNDGVMHQDVLLFHQ